MRKDWKEIKLGEIATFRNGLNYDKDSTTGEGYKIVGVSNFGDKLKPEYSTLSEINPVNTLKEDDYLKVGDIVFVRSNGNKELVGRSMFIDHDIDNLVFSGFCIRARFTSKEVFPLFCAYFFRTELFRKIISASSGGSNIQNLNQGLLSNSNILLPPLATQQKIASILSAYDDLIENNLRRIKLLEEMAAITYKEWFVNFTIDGQKLEIDAETGLPFGWEMKNLNEVFEIKYGKNLPQTEILEKGQFPVYGASGVMGYYNIFNCDKKVVLITSRGNGSGEIHRTHRSAFVTNNSFYVNPKVGFDYYELVFMFEFFKTINLKSYVSGTAQPQLTNASMNNIKIICPIKELVKKFCLDMGKLIDLSDMLSTQNRLLKEARDILLPRLMSGEIPV